MRISLVSATLLGLVSLSSFTQADSFGLDLDGRFYLTAGYSLGGEPLEEFIFTDGDTDEITTGDGFHIGAGGYLSFYDNQWQLQSGISYFFDQTDGNNADMSISRITYELMPFYVYERHRFGGGLIVHFSPEFESDFNGEKVELDFKTAAGVQVEYGYEINPEYTLGIKFSNISYTLEDESLSELRVGEDNRFDAYYGGLFLYGYF